MLETVFNDAYLTIKVDLEKSFFYFEWTTETEFMSLDVYLRYARKILDFELKYKCKYGIDNGLNFRFLVVPKVQEQIARDMLTNINGIVKKWAHVLSEDVITSIAMLQLMEEHVDKKYEDKFFSTAEEAEKWIFNL